VVFPVLPAVKRGRNSEQQAPTVNQSILGFRVALPPVFAGFECFDDRVLATTCPWLELRSQTEQGIKPSVESTRNGIIT
jgi:hypothetical protein